MRQVFLDTETTGLAADAGDRIVEVGCIEMVQRRLTGRTLHHYVNPERASHPDALKVHGLTETFLAAKPRFAQVADELLAFVDGAELIIHNAAFDVAFLDAELARLGRPPLAQVAARITDSLVFARDRFPGKANSLDALCKRLEVDNSHRELHGALLDAGLLAEVWIRMTRGQESLVIDAGEAAAGIVELAAVDFGALALVVVEADADEAAAHEALIAEIDAASGGRAIWKAAMA
jgi:DNA polymerase-3 subunit epsilon